MTELILHIGHPKCGSSTIQSFLSNNVKVLRSQGVGVVNDELDLASKDDEAVSPVACFKALREGKVTSAEISNQIGKLAKTAGRLGLEKLILSAENLANRRINEWLHPDWNQFSSLSIIYYIRRPDDWLISGWKQWQMKIGRTLEEAVAIHLKRGRQNYQEVLLAWMKHLPANRFHIRPLGQGLLKGGDLLTDFASLINVDPALLQKVEDENFGINDTIAHGLSKCSFLFDNTHDNILTDQLKQFLGPGIATNRTDPLGREIRQKILDAHKEEFDWLENSFLGAGALDSWRNAQARKPHMPLTDADAILQMQAINLKLLLALSEKK